MYIDYKDFKQIRQSFRKVFETWFQHIKQFREMVRTSVSRRTEQAGIHNFQTLEKNVLKERLDEISNFRYQHHKLKRVISKTLSKEDTAENKDFEEQALNEINEAYALFLNINVLDISKEGNDIWAASKKTYELKVDKVEGQITASLREKLAKA